MDWIGWEAHPSSKDSHCFGGPSAISNRLWWLIDYHSRQTQQVSQFWSDSSIPPFISLFTPPFISSFLVFLSLHVGLVSMCYYCFIYVFIHNFNFPRFLFCFFTNLGEGILNKTLFIINSTGITHVVFLIWENERKFSCLSYKIK